MPLTNCTACGWQVSTEVTACPQCGHPQRLQQQQQVPTAPTCYACAAQATTRCQSCNALSCAQHLQSIYVSHGKGGAYELRCESCYSSARAWQTIGWVIGIIVLLIAAIIFFGYWLPSWREMGRKHDEMKQRHQEFQKDGNKVNY